MIMELIYFYGFGKIICDYGIDLFEEYKYLLIDTSVSFF